MNAWLAENGLDANVVSPGGDWLAIQLPVSKANEMFDTNYTVLEHKASGKQLIRTMSYEIPSELSGKLDLI